MIRLFDGGVYLLDGEIVSEKDIDTGLDFNILKNAYKGTMSYAILKKHNQKKSTTKDGKLAIKFDALCSHDITYVGIIQTAKASGMQTFPLPYVLTNCHNSLCAVGGTINEDDHAFGYSAAVKCGGIFVPPNQAVIHTYMRENFASPTKMILGSDSHTRYGALGTIAIGEGGPELVKQLLEKTYDIDYPDIIGIRLSGTPRKGVGPQDVALTLIKAVFKSGFVKNKILEFFGDGIANLSMEFRNGIDVMTTETACLSSIWQTDKATKKYLSIHNRGVEYKELKPQKFAYYDGMIDIDLSTVEPMIALPFHPSNVYSIRELTENPYEILKKVSEDGKKLLNNPDYDLTSKIKDGKIIVDQAIIAGCAGGTYDNIAECANIMDGKSIGTKLSMSIYAGSQPTYLDLLEKGYIAKLTKAGAIFKPSFCGPCFGAGDVPQNNGLSIRHTTRNFESREGSKPSEKQIASVALMDARSIAATAINGGVLTSALDIDYDNNIKPQKFDSQVYKNRVYNGYGKGKPDTPYVYGPNIADWPEIPSLPKTLVMKSAAVILDPVTTTDELIPSGEISSLRSNPMRLAEFALSRKRPEYVGLAKQIKKDEESRRQGTLPEEYKKALDLLGITAQDIGIGSFIFATKPGDGSAREQAASSQRVLGGSANIAKEYATKRYRSNLINWGMIPFIDKDEVTYQVGDIIVIKDVEKVLKNGQISAYLVRNNTKQDITLYVDKLTEDEINIIKAGCLMNFYRGK